MNEVRSIGVIGAGPAGLAAAEMLRHQGYQVHVYDRYDRIGGLLIYGIPGFKLEKDIVERRGKLLRDGGVTFHLGVDVGMVRIALKNLRAAHDAILIATGVYKARDISLPGVGLDGIVPALDYLTASNRKSLGDTVPNLIMVCSMRLVRMWWLSAGAILRWIVCGLQSGKSQIGQLFVPS